VTSPGTAKFHDISRMGHGTPMQVVITHVTFNSIISTYAWCYYNGWL